MIELNESAIPDGTFSLFGYESLNILAYLLGFIDYDSLD